MSDIKPEPVESTSDMLCRAIDIWLGSHPDLAELETKYFLTEKKRDKISQKDAKEATTDARDLLNMVSFIYRTCHSAATPDSAKEWAVERDDFIKQMFEQNEQLQQN